MSIKPNRDEAFKILNEYTKTPSLLTHALCVESVMRHFAELEGEDVEKWGVIGLLHDMDYEKYPSEHCIKAREILSALDIDEEYIHAIVSHGYGICSDVKPTLKMEKVLFATDELTGLIYAACLMRPSKSILDLELKSVKKKYKDKRFAAGVDRSIIEKGCEMLNIPLDDVITETIKGMQKSAKEIGLIGNI